MQDRVVSVVVLCIVILGAFPLHSQSPTATVNGQVRDTSGAVVQGADVRLINDTTGVKYTAKTNNDGIYSVTDLPPGTYRLQVSKAGFKTIVKPDIRLNVLDARAINFDLPVGAVSEIVTVEGGVPLVNTESAEVSTVVDRQFAENLPMNGRSFQTLMQLTPGLVLTPTTDQSPGQFSVNGQRASTNYVMVDGVGANIGTSTSPAPSQNASGAIGGFSVVGGTTNLVSVDALQEFRIQTSTYAPEFGRTPGAQISIETRSGTNQLHGTLFDYLRNEAFDANDWFFDLGHFHKAAERQNDFGGVLGGALVKNRTFFFFSYEGLRLRLPQTAIDAVPSLQVRQDPSTPAAILPFLNAFPVPAANAPVFGSVDPDLREFDASYSNRATLDATSLRIDHRLNSKLSIFGRYNYAPSESVERSSSALNTIVHETINTQTLTVGATWSAGPNAKNDFRFNYSRNSAGGRDTLDSFGGATVPPDSFLLPAPFSTQTARAVLSVASAGSQGGGIFAGRDASNVQRQMNYVDGFSIVQGRHSLKFGVDYRRLSPTFAPPNYQLATTFADVASAVALQVYSAYVVSSVPANVIFNNLGVYAQDGWKVSDRLSLTYGLRWDLDVAPHTASGPNFLAITGYKNLSSLAAAPPGTPIFHTTYGNFAPRIGAAYLLSRSPGHETSLRGGFGVFYDLATAQIGDQIYPLLYPFSAGLTCYGSLFQAPGCPPSFTFPLPSSVTQPPQISLANAIGNGFFVGFDPSLKLPYTLQWNLALSQSLGANQMLSASYVGAIGRRLVQQEQTLVPPIYVEYFLDGNTGTSDYHALQLQFQRRVSAGLQVLASYSWSHSVDTGSNSSATLGSVFARGLDPNINRGNSDFDVRNSFSAGVTYDIPSAKKTRLLRMAAGGWSVDSLIQARSAPPAPVSSSLWLAIDSPAGVSQVTVRPDVVPGQPLYLSGTGCVVLSGSICPGGKGLNPNAFTSPPVDPNTGFSFLRQGDLGRNALRGFGATQWDFAVHRNFALKESLHLQFRAEMFNLLNHPNFANPIGDLAQVFFGESTQMLNRGLNGGSRAGTGGFSQLYQVGGPRSIQLALRFQF